VIFLQNPTVILTSEKAFPVSKLHLYE